MHDMIGSVFHITSEDMSATEDITRGSQWGGGGGGVGLVPLTVDG